MFLVRMMCVLFMKRLESSWFALQSTVQKVFKVHEETLEKVVAYRENGIDDILRQGEEVDDEDYDEQIVRRRQIKISDIKNLGGFEKGLRQDINQLRKIVKSLQDFEAKYRAQQERDLKLDELVTILEAKKKSHNKRRK